MQTCCWRQFTWRLCQVGVVCVQHCFMHVCTLMAAHACMHTHMPSGREQACFMHVCTPWLLMHVCTPWLFMHVCTPWLFMHVCTPICPQAVSRDASCMCAHRWLFMHVCTPICPQAVSRVSSQQETLLFSSSGAIFWRHFAKLGCVIHSTCMNFC